MTDHRGGLLGKLFYSDVMAGVFSDHAHVQAMLDFEGALACAEARAGIIPNDAAKLIARKCDARLIDFDALAAGARNAGNTFIPLQAQLVGIVAAEDEAAAGYVHWGATSQDAVDTGMVLQLRRALDVMEGDLARLSEELAVLARTHRDTPMAGRTWLQHALPVTFGVKVAGWLDAVERDRARLEEIKPRASVLQFGGAAGTLASLGDKGIEVAEGLAQEFSLDLPVMPWHTARDRVVEVGLFAALLTGTLGKIARDVSLLMQTDVGEAFEPAGPGRGGSSSMPQKRNPVSCASILAAAGRTPGLAASLLAGMVQEHERGLGGWHAEWAALPELYCLAHGALAETVAMVEGLEVDPARMAANLETTKGQIMAESVKMALGRKIGQSAAHKAIARACRKAGEEGRHLRAVLEEDEEVAGALGADELDAALTPESYLGSAQAFVDRVLDGRRES